MALPADGMTALCGMIARAVVGLDHSSLAVTTVYLRRLEGENDAGWAEVAAAIGV